MSVPVLSLARYAYTPLATLGILYLDHLEFFTLELPWLSNLRGRSCIPTGLYTARPGWHYGSGRKTPSLELLDVPDRSQIEIHIANAASELRGCIAIGKRLGVVGEQWAVLNSEAALTELMAYLHKLAPEGALRLEIFDELEHYKLDELNS